MKRLIATLTLILAGTLMLPPLFAEGTSLFIPSGANFVVYRQGGSNFIINQSRLAQRGLMDNIRKLSSGKRITRAADDPSGLAVAEKMDALISGLKQRAMNDEDMRNYIRYMEQVVAEDQRLLKRIRVLILRTGGGIYSASDRELTQSEIDQLLRQIRMNARFSQFNTKRVIPELTPENLGIADVNVVRDPYGSMEKVDRALDRLIRIRASAGARDNRLEFKIKGQYLYMVNLQAAESRIRDLDMAQEITRLQRNSVMLKTQHGLLIKGRK